MSDSGTYSAGNVKQVLWEISGGGGVVGVLVPMVASPVLESTIPR